MERFSNTEPENFNKVELENGLNRGKNIHTINEFVASINIANCVIVRRKVCLVV